MTAFSKPYAMAGLFGVLSLYIIVLPLMLVFAGVLFLLLSLTDWLHDLQLEFKKELKK